MSEKRVVGNLTIEDASIIFKNFQGKPSQYNREGDRNFGVLLDDETAEKLDRDGWRVKYLRPREDDPEQHRQAWLPVKVKFNNIPPIVELINSRGRIKLDEELIGQLDWTRIAKCDLVISPYNYPEMPGRPAGVTAYLRSLYVTVIEDHLAEKYADIPYLDETVDPADDLPFDE